MQSLISKIVNNITVNCKNLIFKYVEEDIVVSINVKLLTFESANEGWKAAFTGVFNRLFYFLFCFIYCISVVDQGPTQGIIRKLIKLSDLTVCLDKRNASGKIEIYQEPMLYRCFVEIRLLRNYHQNSSKKATTTRLDIHCNRCGFFYSFNNIFRSTYFD